MFPRALLERDADFPKPSYFGRRRRWRVSEIEKYEQVVTARGAPPKKAKQTQDAA
jgi:predicted DNA-binding transcriptional regulator AlpA